MHLGGMLAPGLSCQRTRELGAYPREIASPLRPMDFFGPQAPLGTEPLPGLGSHGKQSRREIPKRLARQTTCHANRAERSRSSPGTYLGGGG